ncbi:MAG: peptidyl-alpha-hydroxyglycine alpha-amidating lyase family protein [Chloroflexota bacterium]
MSITLGSGNLLFAPVENWEQLPPGWAFIDVAGVAVDSKDNVFVFNRSAHPVIVFDRDGNFLRSFGEQNFSQRTHGIHIGPDDTVYCVDDGLHTVQQFTPDGKLLMTLGKPNTPSPKWKGEPFNRPTHVAISPLSRDIYVSDGYGNCRIHRFTHDGQHILSWGEPGIDAGQFIRPHNLVIDKDGLVYVADRENHRIQVFEPNGKFVTMWNNIHRPDGIALDHEGNFFIGELNGIDGVDDCPGLGHRVSVYNLQGQLQTRFGDAEEGEGPTQFIAPHGVAVDSEGSLYVGDVAYTIRGRTMNPPRHLKCFRKFKRVRA